MNHPRIDWRITGRTWAMSICALGLLGVAARYAGSSPEPSCETDEVATTPASQPDPLSRADIALVDQNGQSVHFYADLVKDRVVAVNFVFTTCTTVCPTMGAIFASLQTRVNFGAPAEIGLISVSIDPLVDTPQRLRAWSDRFGAGPGWTLVTGTKPAVDRLLKTLGVYTADPKNHAPIVLLGDGTSGHFRRASGLTSPGQLAEMLHRLVLVRKQERTAQ